MKDHDELVAIKDMPVTSLDIFAEWKNEVEFMAYDPRIGLSTSLMASLGSIRTRTLSKSTAFAPRTTH